MNTTNLLSNNLMALSTSLLLGLNTTVLAQDTAVIPERQASVAGFDIAIADGVFTHKGKTVDATLENVVDMLRDRHQDANIIVAPNVPRITVGDLKLRAANLEQELEALRIASGERFEWSLPGGSQFNPGAGVPIQNREQMLYVLRGAPETGPGRLRVEAFSLGGYFASLPKTDDEDQNKEVIAQAIRELLEIVDETVALYQAIDDQNMYGSVASQKRSLEMRFHRGANLVILIGDPRSIEIAGKVIGALPHAQRSGGVMGRYGEFEGGYGAYGSAPGMGVPRGGRSGGYVPLFHNDEDPFDGGGGMYGGGESVTPIEPPAGVPTSR